MNHSKESDDKDKIRLQSIILFKNLQTTGVMGNIEMQCKILDHLIRRTHIQIKWVMYGEQQMYQTLHDFNSNTSASIEERQFIGFDQMQIMHYCINQDIQLYNENLEVERLYCQRIKHAFDLTNFILTVKPFVCLNFDQNGFNLVR